MKTRRLFLFRITGLLAGVAELASCRDREPDDAPRADKPALIHERTLTAIVDVIMPADQFPGAVGAGVPADLLARIEQDERLKLRVLPAIDHVERAAWRRFQGAFHDLGLETRTHIVKSTLQGRGKDGSNARLGLGVIRTHVVELYYMTPEAWAMLAYTAPWPGGYPDYDAPPPA